VWHGVSQLVDGGSAGSRAGGSLTVLDLGAGAGDIAGYLVRRGRERGITITPLALDRHREAAVLCRARGLPACVADAWALPLRPRSVDVIVISQVLHHFNREAGAALLKSLAPAARLGIVVGDLRRSWFAAVGIWLAGAALRFHPVTRRDGFTSVRRGFTARGLSELLLAAGLAGRVYRRPGFRLVGVWRAAAA
jgi:SAM-dependent methyltransferase